MKPLTMLEFVLSQCDIGMEIQSLQHQIRDRASRFYLIKNYAKFLAQKPEKWMFVPCDDEGNVLEEPIYHEPHSENEIGVYQELRDQYQQALDRVIFEGFTSHNKHWLESKNISFILINNNRLAEYKNIHDLINEHGEFLTLKKPIQ